MSIIDDFEAADLFLLAARVAHLVDLKVDHGLVGVDFHRGGSLVGTEGDSLLRGGRVSDLAPRAFLLQRRGKDLPLLLVLLVLLLLFLVLLLLLLLLFMLMWLLLLLLLLSLLLLLLLAV